MHNLITTEKTSLPIGNSGFFLKEKEKIEDMLIESIESISGSLYEIHLCGMRVTSSDEFSRTSAECWDLNILDLDDQKFYPGYAKKLNGHLYAILDIRSIEVGWPAYDTAIIKNTKTGRKITIESGAPLNDEIVTKDNLFILEGSLWIEHDWGEPYVEEKRWRAFIDEEGKLIYKGFCWEYRISQNFLIIKRGKTSKKERVVRLN